MAMISSLSTSQRNIWWSRTQRRTQPTASVTRESESRPNHNEDYDSDESIPPHEYLETDTVGYDEEDANPWNGPSEEKGAPEPDRDIAEPREFGPDAFDSHFHLDRSCQKLFGRREGSIQELMAIEVDPEVYRVKIQGGVTVFCDPEHFPVDFVPPEGFGAAYGVHPKKAMEFSAAQFDRLYDLVGAKGTVALGEIGLDFTAPQETWQRQEEVLREVLHLAQPIRPLIVHVRDRSEHATSVLYTKVLKIFKECLGRIQRIHLHCFGGSAGQVAAWLDAFPQTYFGFTNMVASFSRNQRAELRQVPRDRILLETDAPYFGRTPAYLGTAAQAVARVLNEGVEDIVRLTERNGRSLYRL